MSTSKPSVAKKKLIIIGAGLSGLAAGVYAQKAGYDTVIYEKNKVPGGECIGWDRKGYHIDGCIHWLTGTSPKDPLNKVWRDVGALSDDVKIYEPESFAVLETPERNLHLYKDMDRLKAHLAVIAPEDREALEDLYNAVEICSSMTIPMKPVEMMNPIEIIKLIASMGKQQKAMNKMKMPLGQYLEKFKNKDIWSLLLSILPPEQCANILPYTLATVMSGNGGRPEGGSRAMSLRMADTFTSLGGKLITGVSIDEIVVEDGCATGVRLTDGGEKKSSTTESAGTFDAADHVLSATDVHVTLKKLLRGKYPQEAFDMRDADPKTYPAMTGCQAAFGIDMDISDMEPDVLLSVESFRFEDHEENRLSFKHYCYEPSFAPEGHSVISIFFGGNYDWWKALAADEVSSPDSDHIISVKYQAEKERVLLDIMKSLQKKYPHWEGHLIPLDFVTPITYERYCGAYRGRWMSYGNTENSKSLMHDGRIKGLTNFSMCGQWLMPPGGTPVAAITGRWAIQRLCKKDKLPWRF